MFHSMVDYPGIEVKCIIDKIGTDRKFKDILIQDNRKCDVIIPHGQLMRSLAANLEKHLMKKRSICVIYFILMM